MAEKRRYDPRNPYGLQRAREVVKPPKKKEERKAPPAPFAAGEQVVCNLRPMLFYTLPVPVKVAAVRATDVCVSGWMVSVKDIDGNVRDLDSGHFSRYKP